MTPTTLEITARYVAMINGELMVALEQCAQFASMPASEQQAHPIPESEFRQRLLAIGDTARAAIRRERAEP